MEAPAFIAGSGAILTLSELPGSIVGEEDFKHRVELKKCKLSKRPLWIASQSKAEMARQMV
jgi:hypothetical protein